MNTKMNLIEAFIDWENIRLRLQDNYIEKMSIDQVMNAIQKVANEIGNLRQAKFYGDFTLRRDEARMIEGKPLFSFRNVLRSRGGRDRTDPVIITELMEAIFSPHEFESILLCSGDTHYCEPIRKISIHKIKIYICAVGIDISPELTSLAPFYPLERYLDISPTRKISGDKQVSLGIDSREISYWIKFIRILEGLDSKLPFIALSYFHKQILLSYYIGGQTDDDRWAYIETAHEKGIVIIEEIDNPIRPGNKMRAIKLNRDNPIVKEILARK